MEPIKDKVRFKLIGPKVQVIKVEKGKLGIKIRLKFPDTSIYMDWDCPTPQADVRIGDLLTLYTEILSDAELSTTSVQ